MAEPYRLSTEEIEKASRVLDGYYGSEGYKVIEEIITAALEEQRERLAEAIDEAIEDDQLAHSEATDICPGCQARRIALRLLSDG